MRKGALNRWNMSTTGGLEAILNRTPPTIMERLLQSPYRYFAETLYYFRRPRLSPLLDQGPNTSSMSKANQSAAIRVVCLSDTHNHIIPDIPDGDILIHAGDLTERGTVEEVQRTVDWLRSLPHRYKIAIAGNHEVCLDTDSKSADDTTPGIIPNEITWGDIRYLFDSSTFLNFPEKSRRIKVYGSPRTPKHGTATLQYPRHIDIWKTKIPVDTDILVTHGPPRHHLDNGAGCYFLLQSLWDVRPKLHVFGHIHVGYGKEFVLWDGFQCCYENLCSGNAGFVTLVMMLGYLFKDILANFLWGSSNNREVALGTILVNAAMVRGRKNELINEVLIQYI